MSNTITQEAYDEVVREFMQDFLMTAEEAIDDAVRHFETQGIDLSNIVKDLALSDKYEPIITRLERLTFAVRDKSYELVPETLQELRTELDKDIGHRVFAGKQKCYNILLDLLKDCRKNHAIVKSALKTITSLMTGNPDLLDDDGIALQIEMLEKYHDIATLQYLLRWIRECCIKHELNRQKIFDANIFERLKKILVREDASVAEIKDACSVIRALVLDDDIRHEYGKAHEHATVIAKGALDILTGLLSRFLKDKTVVGDLMITLAALIVRNEFCQEVEDAGGLKFVQDIMIDYPDSEKLNWQALKLLKALAGNDNVKSHIVTSGCAPIIVSAVSRMKTAEYVVTAGLGCISALSLRSTSNAGVFYDCGAPQVIVDAMKAYPKNTSVLRQACWAIRNMSVRNKSESAEFVAYGVEDVLQNAIRMHGAKLDNDAKAALRDLGLKVDLKERWTGKGVNLNNERQ
ncbi:PREDICTED: armadillo repeat-containing protein 6 homolog [Dinoponera quadriceps]|uniref:Armadillo repeat-containing protein 6 homolog n=1 Tax=Dinoponera quadriceps TaxID=609295 RepID=A0A6P3XUE7_DINQU|nr:PREDICTED: armadillo repeat-containing protein 6 homolog [Dinoponera quadriceps]